MGQCAGFPIANICRQRQHSLGVNAQSEVYQYDFTMLRWDLIPNILLDEVWATFDGAVWGVDPGGNLYNWNSSTQTFTLVSTGVTDVLLGNSVSVWATNASTGAVYYWF